jgi:hypothetical protein
MMNKTVVIYFKDGELVATCPPDKSPEEGTFATWCSGEGETQEEAVRDALAACDWEANRDKPPRRLTVGELIEKLAQFPNEESVLAYEGEDRGLIVGERGFIPTP